MLKTLYNDPIRFLKVLINGELKSSMLKNQTLQERLTTHKFQIFQHFTKRNHAWEYRKKIFTTTSKTTNIIGRLATSYNPFLLLEMHHETHKHFSSIFPQKME